MQKRSEKFKILMLLRNHWSLTQDWSQHLPILPKSLYQQHYELSYLRCLISSTQDLESCIELAGPIQIEPPFHGTWKAWEIEQHKPVKEHVGIFSPWPTFSIQSRQRFTHGIGTNNQGTWALHNCNWMAILIVVLCDIVPWIATTNDNCLPPKILCWRFRPRKVSWVEHPMILVRNDTFREIVVQLQYLLSFEIQNARNLI